MGLIARLSFFALEKPFDVFLVPEGHEQKQSRNAQAAGLVFIGDPEDNA